MVVIDDNIDNSINDIVLTFVVVDILYDMHYVYATSIYQESTCIAWASDKLTCILCLVIY